jgi:hypothetical protein
MESIKFNKEGGNRNGPYACNVQNTAGDIESVSASPSESMFSDVKTNKLRKPKAPTKVRSEIQGDINVSMPNESILSGARADDYVISPQTSKLHRVVSVSSGSSDSKNSKIAEELVTVSGEPLDESSKQSDRLSKVIGVADYKPSSEPLSIQNFINIPIWELVDITYILTILFIACNLFIFLLNLNKVDILPRLYFLKYYCYVLRKRFIPQI